MSTLPDNTTVLTRPAEQDDLPAITDIYNEAILTTTATFDTEEKTIEEQRDWFDKHGEKYPVIVAESENNIVGWASLSEWSDRCAYTDTAEISLYIRENHRGKGIGKVLMKAIIDAGEKSSLHTAIARITEENETSVHLHKSHGFEHIGTMKEVGKKFGKLLNVHMMQKTFNK